MLSKAAHLQPLLKTDFEVPWSKTDVLNIRSGSPNWAVGLLAPSNESLKCETCSEGIDYPNVSFKCTANPSAEMLGLITGVKMG